PVLWPAALVERTPPGLAGEKGQGRTPPLSLQSAGAKMPSAVPSTGNTPSQARDAADPARQRAPQDRRMRMNGQAPAGPREASVQQLAREHRHVVIRQHQCDVVEFGALA